MSDSIINQVLRDFEPKLKACFDLYALTIWPYIVISVTLSELNVTEHWHGDRATTCA